MRQTGGMSGYELSWQGRQLQKYQAYIDDLDGLIYGDTITFIFASLKRTFKAISLLYTIQAEQRSERISIMIF